jgi:hypothetical protein
MRGESKSNPNPPPRKRPIYPASRHESADWRASERGRGRRRGFPCRFVVASSPCWGWTPPWRRGEARRLECATLRPVDRPRPHHTPTLVLFVFLLQPMGRRFQPIRSPPIFFSRKSFLPPWSVGSVQVSSLESKTGYLASSDSQNQARDLPDPNPPRFYITWRHVTMSTCPRPAYMSPVPPVRRRGQINQAA